METQSAAVVGMDEGVSAELQASAPTDAVAEPASLDGAPVPEEVQSEPQGGPPKGYETVPPELWPDKDGNPPQLTEELMRKLRGKYFTVRHIRMACGHKMDQINQPKNNCDECWAGFFGTHPQLVEIAHQMYQTQGRGAIRGLRGEKFVKMFERFMALMYQELQRRQKEQETQRGTENNEPGPDGTTGSDEPSEAPAVSEG